MNTELKEQIDKLLASQRDEKIRVAEIVKSNETLINELKICNYRKNEIEKKLERYEEEMENKIKNMTPRYKKIEKRLHEFGLNDDTKIIKSTNEFIKIICRALKNNVKVKYIKETDKVSI